MIAGHLQIKNDYYYMVLSYLDANGKRKQPWFPTGLPIKNNKKRAEKMLLEVRASNSAAIGLYKKYGFVRDGVRRGYYRFPTEDAWLMSRAL